MEKIIIRKLFIYTEWGSQAIPYILDISKLDTSEDEIILCVQEQIYGDNNLNKLQEKK